VRVVRTDGDPVVGTLLKVSPGGDTLELKDAWSRSRVVATRDVREVYVRVGGRPRGDTAMIGLVLGGVVGALVGATAQTDADRSVGAVVLGMIGSLVGLVGGAAAGGEVWAHAALPRAP
jgi:hypothetical protein